MAMTGAEIEKLIKAALPDAEVAVSALVDDGDHWAAKVTSKAFEGQSRLQQHRMVYAALADQMGGALHALQLETTVPAP